MTLVTVSARLVQTLQFAVFASRAFEAVGCFEGVFHGVVGTLVTNYWIFEALRAVIANWTVKVIVCVSLVCAVEAFGAQETSVLMPKIIVVTLTAFVCLFPEHSNVRCCAWRGRVLVNDWGAFFTIVTIITVTTRACSSSS